MSKFVFGLLAVTACIAFLFEVITGRVTFGTQEFMILATGAFSFYFANKGSKENEYLGK